MAAAADVSHRVRPLAVYRLRVLDQKVYREGTDYAVCNRAQRYIQNLFDKTCWARIV